MNDDLPRIDSREAFIQALRWGFDSAFAQQARCITCVDPSFEDWPLDDPALLSDLTAWVRLPLRRLVLLAASYEQVPRRQPRFTAWRRDFAHAIQALQAPEEFVPGLPTLLLDDRRVSVHLIDPVHWRGRADLDVRARLLWQEKVDVVLQRSEPGFAVSTLGL
ncbi:MAG: hypothetical protein Q7U99_09785 [Rubrivivax sp.]|nr:hypothetical protein [Rubrivivax sp.]